MSNHYLVLKAENSESDITQFESKIDQLVYQLYNLTDEEIAIIEASTS